MEAAGIHFVLSPSAFQYGQLPPRLQFILTQRADVLSVRMIDARGARPLYQRLMAGTSVAL